MAFGGLILLVVAVKAKIQLTATVTKTIDQNHSLPPSANEAHQLEDPKNSLTT